MKGKIPIEIPRELEYVYGEGVTSKDIVRKWVCEFKKGRVDIHDNLSLTQQCPSPYHSSVSRTS